MWGMAGVRGLVTGLEIRVIDSKNKDNGLKRINV